MSSVEFKAWPKIARLAKPMVVTEKMDGTHAAIGIRPLSELTYDAGNDFYNRDNPSDFQLMDGVIATANSDKWGGRMGIYTQSRNRIITPGKGNDNAGFAAWVEENFITLIDDLGPGLHYGEWWGQGIQRNYGLDHKQFSLFNVSKWENTEFETPNVDHVPVLLKYTFDTTLIRQIMGQLKVGGSQHPLAKGFKAEGVVVFHLASGTLYKYTLENDTTPKGRVEGFVRAADDELPI